LKIFIGLVVLTLKVEAPEMLWLEKKVTIKPGLRP
jgi:hypothetical protein